jgi:uncharacterized protein
LLVDTSALFAAVNDNDVFHVSVRNTLTRLAHRRAELFTTNFVVAEFHALTLSRINRYVAAQALERMYASEITTIVRVSTDDEQRALQIVRTYSDKDFALTDAMSFAVMERLQIMDVLTLDQHFAQFGWTTIGLDPRS